MAEAVSAYVGLARRFLSGLGPGGDNAGMAGLGGDELRRFVLAEFGATAVGTAKLTLTQLRSLLRFLHVERHIATDLSAAVPAVAGWRNAGVPKYLEPEQLRVLLGACDRQTADGRRDFAILVTMARLGLRRGEVAALDLEDLDWRAGEMVVKGKGRRDERLPLPAGAGHAIAAYLGQVAGATRLNALCSLRTGLPIAGSRPAPSHVRPAGLACGPGWSQSGRIGCAIRRLLRCCGLAPRLSRSARCFGIVTCPPRRSTRRWTIDRCVNWRARGLIRPSTACPGQIFMIWPCPGRR